MPNNDPKKSKKQFGPKTGDPEKFETWEEFWNAWVNQIQFMIRHTAENYNLLEQLRSEFLPTPYVSTIVRGYAEKALNVRSGGPELRFITIEGVGYATTVDSLLAIKKFVYDDKKYTIAQIKEALLNGYKGNKDQTIMQTMFQMKAPKYGNNDDEIDEIGRKVMETPSFTRGKKRLENLPFVRGEIF